MKYPTSSFSIESFPGSPEFESDNIIHELMLREYCLMNAIENTSYRTPVLSSICDEELLTDLQSSIDFLSSLSSERFNPSETIRGSAEALQWENDLLALFTKSDCRWESVRRLVGELRSISNQLDALSERLAASPPRFQEHRAKFKKHLNHQEKILSTWIKFEMSYGRSVEKVLEKETQVTGEQWNLVTTDIFKPHTSDSSTHSFPHSLKDALHLFLPLKKDATRAA